MRPATRRLLLVLPTAALVILVPLALARPVDPLWIPGVYDDADQDDVVGMLLDARAALANSGRTDATPGRADARALNLAADSRILASAALTFRLRSPPSR